MIGSEQHFRTTLGQERASVLLQALEASSSRARALAIQEDFGESLTPPVVAFDLAIKGLSTGFDLLDGIRSLQSKGQHLRIIDECYALRVKKLTSGYRSSNHYSHQQELMSQQSRLPGLDPFIFVTAGPVYSDRTGLVEEFVVVKYHKGTMRHQEPEWVVNLHDLAAGGMVPTTPTLPLPTAPAAPAALSPKRASYGTRGVEHGER